MATKKFSDYAVQGQNVTLTYDNINDTVTFDVVVDKTDIGLGNVDNTSDANKPISSATQTALNLKQDTLVSGTNIKTVNSNTLLGSGDVVIDKSSVGLENVANVDTTNASNISSGTLGDARLSANVTIQGNTFNAASKLVQLDASAKLPAVDGSQLTNLPSFSPPNGLLKIASAISTTFQVVKDYLDNASVLFLNSRRIGIGKDTSVTTQSVAVVEVQDANTSIVLKPNGTGGIIASVPDGTATGGNARGNYSVDLQIDRTANTQVVAGNNGFIGSGSKNTIGTNANYNGIVSGESNIFASNADRGFIGSGSGNRIGRDYAVINGGLNNTISEFNSGDYGVIGGGASNTASSQYSTISGGQSNTASTNTHATVVGGQSNTASGNGAIAGGVSNTASGQYAIALGNLCLANVNNSVSMGYNNQSLGSGSFSIGNNNISYQAGSITFGYNNSSNISYGTAAGFHATSHLYGEFSYASGRFTSSSDAQQSLLTARRQSDLTTGATSSLSLDGTGTTNLIIPSGNNRAWNVTIDTIAVVTAITGTATGVSVGDCYRETKQLLFKRIGGTSSIVGTVDTSAIKSDSGMATASITISAGGSQQMAITFTAPIFLGGGSVTCRVVSKVSLVECAY